MTGAQELRYAAFAEAVTLASLICIAMPLKRLADIPAATSIMGPIHGIVFLFFIWIVIRSWAEGLVNGWGAGRLVLGAMIPFAGFVNERWLARGFAGEDT
ncbi:DUF3817 domain-containing protein [Rhodobacteraceae bacterium N5(2021)]|uniref:DUF3817 domain-containing protein n=1 Tax=Gymnodinialimonas phycosphaerae TaxID=2841589 RepID=A0A975TUF4_9RHOB|nr:DUF3817 domain-containing protein [Gymnodinialimonas phycosphaerae]MBY4894792.1 DUF3817 domain-containing protein [Gymnodinialimonas phycosphaerae]